MSKTARRARLGDDSVRAFARSLKVGPRKLGMVVAGIRGKPLDVALNDLQFSRRRIAGDVRKVLLSAMANAENNHGLDVDRLVVAEATVGPGLKMRRFRPAGRGRVHPYRKEFSNLEIVLRETSSGED